MISFAGPTRYSRASLRSWRLRAATCACASLLAACGAFAGRQAAPAATAPVTTQSAGTVDDGTREVRPDTPDATRAELTQLLEASLRRAADASLRPADRTRAQNDAAAIRQRLEAGDFQPGDRFVLTVVADSLRHSEILVRDGPSIEFGALPAMSLTGVLRSELDKAIHQHLSKYFRTPEVRVQFLTRVTISGAVGKPGTYSVPSFLLTSDVITQAAGGFLPIADPDKIVVTRAGREIVDEDEYRRATKEGYTLERLGVQSGDEIRVGERGGRRNWAQLATFAMVGVSAFAALLALIRSSYTE